MTGGSAGSASGSGSGGLVLVAVDDERCIGAGQCEMLEPDVFVVDDDSAVSSVIGAGALARERADVVVHRCPGAAISIVGPADSPAAAD